MHHILWSLEPHFLLRLSVRMGVITDCGFVSSSLALLFARHGISAESLVPTPVLHIPCLPATEARFRAQAGPMELVKQSRSLNPEPIFSLVLTASLQLPATHCSFLKMEGSGRVPDHSQGHMPSVTEDHGW